MQKYKKLKFRGTKYRKVFLIFILTLFIGVGYAIFPAELSVSGNLEVKKSWRVYLDNITVTAGSVSVTPPSLGVTGFDYSISYSVSLSRLEHYYDFTFDIVNAGQIDAKIYDLVFSLEPDSDSKYYRYQITHVSNNEAVKKDDVIAAGAREKIRVRFELNNSDDINLAEIIGKDYEGTGARTVNLTANFNIRQV